MKTHHIIITVVLVFGLCILVPPLQGAGADSPRDSFWHARSLDRLSVGGAYEKQERDLEDEFGLTGALEARHVYAFLSLDVFSWLTVNGGVGQTEVKPQKLMTYADEDEMWMVGVRLNLWEYDIVDPSFLASVCRLQAAASHWEHDGDAWGGNLEWEEQRAALLFQAESYVLDFGKDPGTYPYSVIFSIGPVYSEIEMETDIPPPWTASIPSPKVDLEEEDSLGLLGSIDVNIAHNFSVGWEVRVYDQATHAVNVAFHF